MSFYIHDGSTSFRFEIEGSLAGDAAWQVDQAWRTASSVIGSRALIVVVGNLTSIDSFGRELLLRFHGAGAQLVAKSPMAKALVSSIAGQPSPPAAATGQINRRWLRARALPLVLLTVFFLPEATNGASLEQTTSDIWEDYLHSARARLVGSAYPGNAFLWVDADPTRLARVRAGEIIVAPVGLQSPTRIQSGLIHDWRGATFITNATLKQSLLVVCDYAKFKDFYRPTVVDSRVIATSQNKDRFSLRLMDALLPRTALDIDFESDYFHLDDRRAYGISQATRIQEIDGYGTACQRTLNEGEGYGIVWRLFTFTRFVERDGGVYIEIEAIGLSRDIPASLRWIVEPIVHRVSQASLTASLREMASAIHSRELD